LHSNPDGHLQRIMGYKIFLINFRYFRKTPLDEISRSTFETFLDECITTRDKKANDITIDYNFLITPNRHRTNDSADKDGYESQTFSL
jgi:hypothetical protein